MTTNSTPSAKYTVHIYGNGSTGYARDMVHAVSLAEVRAELARFARGTYAVNESAPEGDPGAWADVYPYTPEDRIELTHGDYPLTRFVTGPRGGIARVAV